MRLRWTLVSSLLGSLFLFSCSDDDALGDGTSSTESGDETGEELDPDLFPGLSDSVDIVRDEMGIPHIYGATDADVYYAAGYQMATDRLFQMDLVRRRALGRQVEVLGEDKRDSDELSHVMNFKGWGQANLDLVREESPEIHALVVAWLAGVNRRIEEVRAGDAPLPYGFGPDELDYMPETWELVDHYAIARLFFFGSSNQLEFDMLASILEMLIPETFAEIEIPRPMFDVAIMPPDEMPSGGDIQPPVFGGSASRADVSSLSAGDLAAGISRFHGALADLAPTTGSNNWALSGEHSANGRPLIAGDPHQPLDSPSVMYAHHLNSADAGGSLDVVGFSFAGIAGVHLGHNRTLAWTATTNFADSSDLWLVDEQDGQVKIGDEWVDLVVREETIAGQTYRVEEVPGHGVILPNELAPVPIAGAGQKLLFDWTGFRGTTDEVGFLSINTATNASEFEQAVDALQISGFNFLGADTTDIAYRVNLLVPDRGDPSARKMPYVALDGNDPGNFWDGFLPADKLPRSRGGERGWITTANNDPWGFTFDGSVENDPWYYGTFFASGHRAKRIDDQLTLMTESGNITPEDMKALQTDTHSATSDVLLPMLETAWSKVGNDPAFDAFANRPELETLATLLLQDWDQRMAADSAGALAYHLFLMFTAERTVGDELTLFWPTLLEAEAPVIIKIPLLALKGDYGTDSPLLDDPVDRLVLKGLEDAADFLIDKYGSVDPSGYQWSEMHGTFFNNPYGGELELGFVGHAGGEDTVNVSSSVFVDEMAKVKDRFDSGDGAVYRMVTHFDDSGMPRAEINFPPGNVAEPSSVFWDNTLDAWVAGEYSPLPYTREEVDAVTVETFVLEPLP